MKLSKGIIAIIAVIAIVFVIGSWAASAYNSMVGVQEQATTGSPTSSQPISVVPTDS